MHRPPAGALLRRARRSAPNRRISAKRDRCDEARPPLAGVAAAGAASVALSAVSRQGTRGRAGLVDHELGSDRQQCLAIRSPYRGPLRVGRRWQPSRSNRSTSTHRCLASIAYSALPPPHASPDSARPVEALVVDSHTVPGHAAHSHGEIGIRPTQPLHRPAAGSGGTGSTSSSSTAEPAACIRPRTEYFSTTLAFRTLRRRSRRSTGRARRPSAAAETEPAESERMIDIAIRGLPIVVITTLREWDVAAKAYQAPTHYEGLL